MNVLISFALGLAGISSPGMERSRHSEFAECVVKRSPTAAAEYVLDIETDEAEARKMHKELPLVACWEKLAGISGAQLRLPGNLLRYILADALARRELSAPPVSTFAASPPLPRAALTDEPFRPKAGKKASGRELEEFADARRQALVDANMAAFGECVARAAPQDSHALLMTKVGSPEESTGFRVLSRAFGGCIPAGQTLSSVDLEVRGPIALSYYRLAKAGSQK